MSQKAEQQDHPVTNGEQLSRLQQVKYAYADTRERRRLDAYQQDDRDLKFLTSSWFNVTVAGEIQYGPLADAIEAIGPYNKFDPAKVIGRVHACAEADENPFKEGESPLRVAIGREGSPVLYIECDRPEQVIGCLEDYADECWHVDADSVGLARSYMSNGETAEEVLRYSNRDEFLVHPDEFAEPNEEREVVRAWWD